MRQIGEELNVATVLEGSVRRDGNRLRIVAQLIGAADGFHVWSQTYDRELKNLFSVEDELARAIVQALKPRLLPSAALVAQATASTEAHDLYLRGRFFWNQRTKEGLAKAESLFEQAIALDPNYALAHSGLADCYSLSKDYGQARGAEVLPKAKEHALKAVELDDALAEGHASLGLLRMDDYQWDAAEREFKRAIELRPGYATAHHWYALLLEWTGRVAESKAEAEQARRLDPTSVIINNLVTSTLYYSRDYEGAIAQAVKTLEFNPASDLARVWLALVYEQVGKFAEALATLDKAPAQHSALQSLRPSLLAALGDRAAALRLLADIEKGFPAAPVPDGFLAKAHLTLRDQDGAFEWLQRGVVESDQTASNLKVGPQWDALRSDPRYHDLLKRMNLE